MDRQFDTNSKYVIIVQIGDCLGALNLLTFVMTMKLTLWITFFMV